MRNIWRAQADSIDFQDKSILNVLYENKLVSDFLAKRIIKTYDGSIDFYFDSDNYQFNTTVILKSIQ